MHVMPCNLLVWPFSSVTHCPLDVETSRIAERSLPTARVPL